MGCGSVADFGHVPAILATEGLELAALYDPDQARLDAFLAKFGPRFATTHEDAFWDQGLDTIAIASPAWAHRENVLAAARRGIPVLCEKPIALSEEDGEEMASAMEAAGALFGIGYCYRFAPVSLRIRDLVRSGAIGEPRSLRLQYIWNLHGIWEPATQPPHPLPEFHRGRLVPEGMQYSRARSARMEEGGPMVDCGVHAIDLARCWLGKEPVSWSGHGAWVEGFDAPDHVYLHMDHEGGAHTMVEMSFTYTHTAKDPISYFHYHLIGTDGVLLYDRDAGRFEIRNSRGYEPLPWSHEKNFHGMYAAWRDALRSGDLGDFPSARDGILATRIANDATREAMQRRKALSDVLSRR